MKSTRRCGSMAAVLIGLASVGIAQAQALKVPPTPQKPVVYRNRLMVNTTTNECVVPDVSALLPSPPPKRDRYRRWPQPKPQPQPSVSGPAKAGLATCTFEELQNQLWHWVGVGQDKGSGNWDAFVMQNASKRVCLGVENRSTQPGAALVPVSCDLSDPSQMWIRLTGNNSTSPARPAPPTAWINVNSALCMTAWVDPDKRTTLRQFSCQNTGFGPQEFFGIVF